MNERTGKCLCGAVRLTARAVNDSFAACHCKMCQRWTGGPLMAVSVKAADIAFEGEEHIGRIRSSDWAERGFCKKCGSGLWYRVVKHDGSDYEVPLGLFDDPAGITMTSEIFIDRKPDAYALAGDHPRLTEAQVMARYRQQGEME